VHITAQLNRRSPRIWRRSVARPVRAVVIQPCKAISITMMLFHHDQITSCASKKTTAPKKSWDRARLTTDSNGKPPAVLPRIASSGGETKFPVDDYAYRCFWRAIALSFAASKQYRLQAAPRQTSDVVYGAKRIVLLVLTLRYCGWIMFQVGIRPVSTCSCSYMMGAWGIVIFKS
jgi:hypothetical protein